MENTNLYDDIVTAAIYHCRDTLNLRKVRIVEIKDSIMTSETFFLYNILLNCRQFYGDFDINLPNIPWRKKIKFRLQHKILKDTKIKKNMTITSINASDFLDGFKEHIEYHEEINFYKLISMISKDYYNFDGR